MALTVLSPVSGTVVAMADVPDPVFAEGMVGPGIAVDPSVDGATSDVVAPCGGTLVKLHPHAFVVVATEDAVATEGREAGGGPWGRGVLVHLGIDTVQLGGAGFTVHVAEGDVVAAGRRLVTWSPTEVSDGGRSPLVPVVALDLSPADLQVLTAPGDPIAAGDPLLRLG
ncbi:PTS glucose transporter subunit IIA [Myceligenerans halotolerans]